MNEVANIDVRDTNIHQNFAQRTRHVMDAMIARRPQQRHQFGIVKFDRHRLLEYRHVRIRPIRMRCEAIGDLYCIVRQPRCRRIAGRQYQSSCFVVVDCAERSHHLSIRLRSAGADDAADADRSLVVREHRMLVREFRSVDDEFAHRVLDLAQSMPNRRRRCGIRCDAMRDPTRQLRRVFAQQRMRLAHARLQ